MVDLLEEILNSNERIRMVVSLNTPMGESERVSREDLDSIELDDDWNFLNITATAMITMFQKYNEKFGELIMSGACMEKVNFFFFRKNEKIILVSTDPGPISEILEDIQKFIENK